MCKRGCCCQHGHGCPAIDGDQKTAGRNQRRHYGEHPHKLARACRIIDVSTASTPAAQKAADAYALEAALYAVAYESARLVRSDMWPLVAMRLDAAQEVGTRTSDLHIRHPLAVRGSTAQNLVEELLYAAAKRGRRRQDWANALEAAVACGCMMDAVLNYPPRWENQDGK